MGEGFVPVKMPDEKTGTSETPEAAGRKLEKFLRTGRRWRFVYLASLSAGRAFVFFLAVGAVLFLLDWLHPISPSWRQLLWTAGVIVSLAVGASRAGNWRTLALRHVALDLGRKLEPIDGFLNAWELARSPVSQGVSDDLVRKYVSEMASETADIRPSRLVEPRFWRGWITISIIALAVTVGVFTLLPTAGRSAMLRVYYPFGLDGLAGMLSVSPGNTVFLSGQDVAIRLREASARPGEPQLWISASSLGWEKLPLNRVSAVEHEYIFRALTEPVTYKVKFQGRWSSDYRLSPYTPPQFVSFRTEVRNPPYAGRAPEVVENSLLVRALQGSEIRLSGRLDQSVSGVAALFADGRIVPGRVSSGKEVALNLEAQQSGEFALRFESEEQTPGARVSDSLATEAQGPAFRIEVIPDAAPRVQILAPAQDLMASAADRVPVVYEVEDDYGISEVYFHYSVNGGPARRVTWNQLPKPSPRGTYDKTWSLESLRLEAGDIVHYHLSAKDNNSVTGPREGTSASFLVQIASYEMEHSRLEESLEEYRKSLLKLLADQSGVLESTKETSPDWNKLAAMQSALNARALDQKERLQAIVRKMAEDPLSDRVSLAEHQAASSSLGDLTANSFPRALSALNIRDSQSAQRSMEEIISELERLSLLSEDVLQSQRMRRLLEQQDDLTQSASTLTEDLDALQAAGLSPEDQKRMGETLKEMAQLLEEISKQLKDFPQELPDEFVNKESVKTLNLGDVASAMENVRQALARGDAASALEQSRRALEKLRQIQKALREAGQDVAGGPDWYGSRLLQKTQELEKRLETLITRQEDLKTRIQKFANAAVGALINKQKKELATAAARQESLVPVWERLKQTVSDVPGAALFAETRFPLHRLETLSADVRREIDAQQLKETPKWIPEIKSHLESVRTSLRHVQESLLKNNSARGASGLPGPERSRYERYAAAEKDTDLLLKETEDLLRDLDSSPVESELLTQEQRETVKASAPEQQKLRQDTLSLRHDVQILSRQTALLGGRLPRRLELAGQAMSAAAENLVAIEPRSAIGDQETALKYLREGQEDLSSASQQMQQAGGSGGGSSSLRVLQGRGSSGGAASGPVRIPRAEDYHPPKEFREELLRGMKEKYPKEYEGAIQDYYENWNR